MSKKTWIVLALLGLTATAQAAELQWPQDAMDETDPRVVAFYNQQCTQWSEQSNLQGAEREAFHANCMASASQLWPVGPEPDGDG